MYIFEKYIFCHLKLKIALAIPASNDEKYNSNNSAGQGLSYVPCSPASIANYHDYLYAITIIRHYYFYHVHFYLKRPHFY